MQSLIDPEKVERGAKLLDAKRPGWWKRINAETLDISSCTRCVVGQLYGEYDNYALDQLGIRSGVDHGFNSDYSLCHIEGDINATCRNFEAAERLLKDEWVKQIEYRRKLDSDVNGLLNAFV